MAAYVCSTVGPGSLSHLGLAAQLLPIATDALLWFGLCAGLHPDSSVASELGGVGRRTLRDLCMPEPRLGRARHDISLAELEIYAAGPLHSDAFTAGSPSRLVIELSPGVSTVVNWAARQSRGLAPTEAPQQRAPIAPHQDRLLSEIRMALDQAQRLLAQLTDDGSDRQPGLFDPKGKRRRKMSANGHA